MLINLVGQKFGKLVVIQRMDNDKRGRSRWLCECSCGKEKIVRSDHLRSGGTRSCGCLSIKHGLYRNGKTYKPYQIWRHMIGRCINPNYIQYNGYGGRGIAVCKRWRKLENFLEDMGEPPTDKHQIDRINNDGDYCPSNCRWATRKQQMRNRRNNHLETYMGKTQCLAAWAEEFGIPYQVLWQRICMLGWSLKKALISPIR